MTRSRTIKPYTMEEAVIKISDLQNLVGSIVRSTISSLRDEGVLPQLEAVEKYNAYNDTYVSGTEAAQILGVTSSAITRMRKMRKIKGVRIGKVYKYNLKDIYDYKITGSRMTS